MSLFSVNTNLGALAALQSLETTQQSLNQAQSEVSTGQKVSSAADNPAIYSIANTINANIAGLSAVSDSLNFGAQVVATASSAVTSVSTVLQSLQQTVTSSNTSGENLTTLQNQVSAALTAINQYASTATFSGVNLLVGSNGGNVTSNSLNVVQSVDGGVYNVANQIAANGGTATSTLTDVLGLTGLNINTGSANATIGANIAFGTGTTVGAAANAGTPAQGTFQYGTAGTDYAVQINTGTGASAHSYTFEFNDLADAQQLQSENTASNTVVAVNFDSTKDSTNQIVAKLASAISANGFGVVGQPDGSLNIVGNNLTDVAYGTVAAGAFAGVGNTATANGLVGSTTYNTAVTNESTNEGVAIGTLTTNSAAVTAVQTAVSTLNTISANLGAATQQITGIQNFTSALSSALTAGVGALTDADLATESAKLTSLQTKQQLATQSLTIANQQPQSLLTLFKNA